MSEKVETKFNSVSDARDSLRQSIDRLPASVQGWPKHVLAHGTDADVIDFASKLARK